MHLIKTKFKTAANYFKLLSFLSLFLPLGCSFSPNIDAIKAQLLPFTSPTITSSTSTAFTGGGTDIEVSGANFGAGVSISISGKDCQLRKISGTTKINCTAPPMSTGTYDLVLTGVDGSTVTRTVTYDPLAFTQMSLMVGKLGDPAGSNADGYFNNADSRGANQIVRDGNILYTADMDGYKIKKTDLATLKSTTLIGTGANAGVDITPTDPKLALLDSPRCLAKAGNILYVCLSTTAIGKFDLDTNILTVFAGRIPADGNTYTGTDPLGDKFDSIRSIFINGGSLFVVDFDMIKKIDLAGPTYSDFAGVSAAGAQADGTGTGAQFNELGSAVLLDGALYVGDEVDSYSANLRKVDLTTAAVTTVVGDIAAPINYGDEATDGIGPLASINKLYGLTVYGNKLILLDMYDKYKVRLFDPSTAALTTIKTVNLNGTKNVLGLLSDKASLRSSRVRSIYYAENYGLVLGTEYGLYRLQ